ncbi:polyisoprenoid-binding protein YceI [Flavobacteriaceae bacterium MAR_2009_75]|nr:polyisoprenoid-binding protein YceI [Flavobacteriaceae bacterium MAR_2009_75]
MYRNTIFLFIIYFTLQHVYAQNTTDISSADITFTFISKNVEGSVSGFKSSSNIDLAHIENSKFVGSVAVETLKTGNFIRDWSLKGNKYFDADSHPRLSFESTEIVKMDDGSYSVNGNLTIKGIEKPITFRIERRDNRLLGTTTLFTSDFDIHIKDQREDNKVIVTLNLRL